MKNGNLLNLTLRSIFHIFVSGSIFYFFRHAFHVTLVFGTIGAFFTAAINEIYEDIRKVENSFHTKEVFLRDRLLAALSLLFTTIIIKFNLLTATILTPISLMAATSYIDKRGGRIKRGQRNLIKPVVDIASITIGPIICLLIVSHIKG